MYDLNFGPEGMFGTSLPGEVRFHPLWTRNSLNESTPLIEVLHLREFTKNYCVASSFKGCVAPVYGVSPTIDANAPSGNQTWKQLD